MSSESFFVVDKVSQDLFKCGIITSIEAKGAPKFALGVSLNHVKEKVNPQYKLSYKVFNEKIGSDQFLYISPFSTQI